MSGFDQGRIRVGHHFQATLPQVNAAKSRDSDPQVKFEACYWPPTKLHLEDREIDDYLSAARNKLKDSDAAVRYAKNADSVEAQRSGKSDGTSRESALDELHVAVALDMLFDSTSTDDALERFVVRAASFTAPRSGEPPSPLLSGAYGFGETRWTCEERAAFVRAMRAFPKDFNAIRAAHFTHKTIKEVIAYYYKWKRTPAGRQVMDTIKAQRKASSIITEGGVQHSSPRARDSARNVSKRGLSKEDRDADWRETPAKVRRSGSTSASVTPRASRSSDRDHASMKRKPEVESDSEDEDYDGMDDEPMVPSPPPSAVQDECFKKPTGVFLRMWKRAENSCARADLSYKSTRSKAAHPASSASAAASTCGVASSISNANPNPIQANAHSTVSVKVEPKIEPKVEPRSAQPSVRNPVSSGPGKWNLPTASVKPERSFSLVEPHPPASAAAAAASFSRQASFPPGASPPELAALYQKLAQAGTGLDPLGLMSKSNELDAAAFERQLREMAVLEQARNAALAAASSSGPPPHAGVGSFEQFCKAMLSLSAGQQPQHQPPNPFSHLDPVHMPFGLPPDSNALLNMLGAPFRQPPFPNPMPPAQHPFPPLAAFNSLLQAAPQLGSPPAAPHSAFNPLAAFQRGPAHSHPGQPPLAHAHDRTPAPFDSLLKAAQFGEGPRGAALAALSQQLAAHAHAQTPAAGSPFKLPALGGLGLSQLAGSHPQPPARVPHSTSVPKAHEPPTDPNKLNVTVNISMRDPPPPTDAPEPSAPKPNTPKGSNVDGNVNVTVAPPTAAIIPMHTHTHTHFHLHSQSNDGTPTSTSTDSQPSAALSSRSAQQPRSSHSHSHSAAASSGSAKAEPGRPLSSVKAEPIAAVAPAATAARPPAADDAASRQLEQLARAVLALQQNELPAGLAFPGLNLPPGLPSLPGFPPFGQPPGHSGANANANAAQAQLLANLANALQQSFGSSFRN